MKRMVVISGPQAAGKSTCILSLGGFIDNLYPSLPEAQDITHFCLQESRQVITHKYHLMGAIFMTADHEREIIKCDLTRMKVIDGELDERLLYVDECNVFTLAHAKAHGIDLAEKYLPIYQKALEKLHAVVVFLDLTPDISWKRRISRYQARLHRFPPEHRDDILRRYRGYLDMLYPELLAIYDRLALPKIKIQAEDSHHLVMRQINTFLFKQGIL